jgi:hypothetical protein
MKALIEIAITGLAACASATSAFAYTINGKAPSGNKSATVKLHNPIKPGFMQFTFSGAGALDFCIGPAVNPCGSYTSRVVSVPAGQTRTEVFPSTFVSENVIVARQSTGARVPFKLDVGYVQ